MRTIKITIAYNGSAYHGWQRQNNNITVQEVFENTISRILNSKTVVHGCSRTDAGVHAKEFVVSLKTDNPVPCPGLVKAMNALLPGDIAVLSCEDADESFHARFSAKGKEYIYIVNTAPQRDVFAQGLALHYPYRLDAARLDKAARLFVGKHDFGAFCKAEAKEHLTTTVRTVFSAGVTENGSNVIFSISGDGFLHNMVRIIVGTLIYINEGKLSEDDIPELLMTGDRTAAGVTIPPHGLYLNKVFYTNTGGTI